MSTTFRNQPITQLDQICFESAEPLWNLSQFVALPNEQTDYEKFLVNIDPGTSFNQDIHTSSSLELRSHVRRGIKIESVTRVQLEADDKR